ncbi:sensor histidine kinase [Lacunimicrobium album]
MRLADFIVANIEPILLEWEAFARSITPDKNMDVLALRDHAEIILLATVQDMQSEQSDAERDAKSKGNTSDDEEDENLDEASKLHAIERLGSGFDLLELVSEYRALRASVLRLWHESRPQPQDNDVDDVTRFNESIDQSLVKAVSSYTNRVDQSRDLFLAILGHDLRNPLNSIAMAAALLPRLLPPGSEVNELASQISANTGVMARMISDLLEFTRTRLGAGMPVSPVSMDLSLLCQELYHEFQISFPKRQIRIQSKGNMRGNWDADRLRQAISNLMGNAIQHSPDNALVELRLSETEADVELVVANGGPPIPAGELSRIFEPLVRGTSSAHSKPDRPGSIGLGLYIAQSIVRSHGGKITVTSSENTGTAFTVNLPREFSPTTGKSPLDKAFKAAV